MSKNQLITEEQLLKELNIPDWRHMSKDKLITFASSLHSLSPEVAKSVISQFPNFKEMGNEMVFIMKDSLNTVVDSESKNSKLSYELNSKILDGLNQRLSKPFLLPGERNKIIDAMLEVSKNISEMDSNHKTFLAGALNGVKTVALGALVISGAILGATFRKD